MIPGLDYPDAARGHAEAAHAEVAFATTLAALRSGIVNHDGIEILARSAFAMLVRMAGLKADPQAKGIEVFHIEIIQALALSAPRGLGRDHEESADRTQASVELIERNGQAYRRRWLSKLTGNSADDDRQALMALLRDYTLAVRGPRHFHQTEEYLRAICDRIEPTFMQRFECGAHDVLSMLLAISTVIGRRMQIHLAWLRTWTRKKTGVAMIDTFLANAAPNVVEQVRSAVMRHRFDRKAIFAYLWTHAEDRLSSIFTISADEILSGLPEPARPPLAALLDSLSLGFGDIGKPALEHLHLANPVRSQPLIRLEDGRYFCCNPMSLNTNLAEIFDALCARFDATKERLEKVRAEWLESKLRDVVRQQFPSAHVHHSVKWVNPADGTDGESDVVALIDKTLLIFEAKSGAISAPARRGALNSLKGALKDLVVEPSDQSLRLKRYLKMTPGTVSLQSADGILEIDTDSLRDIVRINVLMEPIGPLSAHWPQLKATGLLPHDADIAPTMSIFELETVLEVLRLQIERCHYLSRRSALEMKVAWVADELDLLALYLESQFCIDEAASVDGIWLYGKSLGITVGYSEKHVAGTLNFPIRRTDLWTSLLEALERHQPVGWTRFGHRLLNVTFSGQQTFARLVRDGWKSARKHRDQFFTSALSLESDGVRQTVAFVIGMQPDPAQFQSNIQQAAAAAFNQGGASDMLLIYWFLPETGHAYDFIGVLKRSPFFVPQFGFDHHSAASW